MQSCLAGKGAVQHQRARQRRLDQMAGWEGVPEKGTKWIPLGRGKKATVSEHDYAFLMQWNWHCSALGYAIRFTGPKASVRAIWMHRLILGLPPDRQLQTDHIDGDRLNNQRSNLRVCSATENQGNRWKSKHAKTSRFKGVYFCKKLQRFVAYGREGAKNKRLGSFIHEKDAARAYDTWAMGYFGQFAKLNL